MKIGISTLGADGGKSGIGEYVINLLKEFDEMPQAHEFECLVAEQESDIFIPRAGGRIQPVKLNPKLVKPGPSFIWHQRGLPDLCRRRGYDVLLLTAGNRRLPFSLPCAKVGAVHDLSSLHVANKYGWIRGMYSRHLLPMLIRQLDEVITISESSKRDIFEFARVPEKKITVVPLAMSPHFKPCSGAQAQQEVREKYGLRKPYIFYVARIEHPGKNHVGLIQAFTRLKKEFQIPHQLVLGGSDWTRAERVHQAAGESLASGDILFTGFVPNADLPMLYAAADLFVFPSLYEGFGIPILEAMASGIPVVCSNTSSMPEVAGDAALFFAPQNADEMVLAMLRVIRDPDFKKEMVRKGLDWARQFSWKKTAEQTLQVLVRAAKAVRS